MEQQIEEQKQRKDEYEKKTMELNSEFASLMKQEKELTERKTKKKAEKEKQIKEQAESSEQKP